jgi:hypothetical protein
MAHFAFLDENNVVVNVIRVDNSDCLDENGNESEEVGIAFCNSIIKGKWVQTSYNNSFRKNYAGIGYAYDPILDAFIPPQNFSSWILDETTCRWNPPVPMPEEGQWYWDENSQSWIEVELTSQEATEA